MTNPHHDHKQFPTDKVKLIAETVLKEIFDDLEFDVRKSPSFLQEATKIISSELKKHITDSFEYFVHLSLNEKIGQAFTTGSMCLWDDEKDRYVSTSFETSSFVCIAVIFFCHIS